MRVHERLCLFTELEKYGPKAKKYLDSRLKVRRHVRKGTLDTPEGQEARAQAPRRLLSTLACLLPHPDARIRGGAHAGLNNQLLAHGTKRKQCLEVVSL